jgi:hypothetical protein
MEEARDDGAGDWLADLDGEADDAAICALPTRAYDVLFEQLTGRKTHSEATVIAAAAIHLVENLAELLGTD